MSGDIPAGSHTVDGSQRLTNEQALAYLTGEGYGSEALALMADAARFPCGYKYTADRHRYAVYTMPGGYWMAGDCAESEERIKALGRKRRGEI
jgi:hypothetical protein